MPLVGPFARVRTLVIRLRHRSHPFRTFAVRFIQRLFHV